MVESVRDFAANMRAGLQAINSGKQPESPAVLAGRAAEPTSTEAEPQRIEVEVGEGEEVPVVQINRPAPKPALEKGPDGRFLPKDRAEGATETPAAGADANAADTAAARAAATQAALDIGGRSVGIDEVVSLLELKRSHDEGTTSLHQLMGQLEEKEREVTAELPRKLAEADTERARFQRSLASVNNLLALANKDPAAFRYIAQQYPNGLPPELVGGAHATVATPSNTAPAADDNAPLTRGSLLAILAEQEAGKKAAQQAEDAKLAETARETSFNTLINTEVDRLAGGSKAMKRLMLGHIMIAQQRNEIHKSQQPDVVKYLIGKVHGFAKADIDEERGLAGHRPNPAAKQLPPASKSTTTPLVTTREPRTAAELKAKILGHLNAANAGVVRR